MKLKQKIESIIRGLTFNLSPAIIKTNAECSDELFDFVKENIAEYSANSFETISKLVRELKLKYPYKDISNLLGCSAANVWYYYSEDNCNTFKNRQSERRMIAKIVNENNLPSDYLIKKIKRFANEKYDNRALVTKIKAFYKGKKMDKDYIDKSVKKITDNPVCYLTGRVIDLSDKGSYELDHITPVSRGGANTIENMGLTCSLANRCKGALTAEEFIKLCKEVAANNQ